MDAYRDELGYLPEAVSNYLLRLGWGHGDDEIISRPQAIEWFDLAHVGRSPSRFDFKKLENLNGHYLREADDARLAALVAPRVEALIRHRLDDRERDVLTRAMESLKPRAKTLDEIADGAMFLFQADPLPVDEKAAEVLKAAPEGVLAAGTHRRGGKNSVLGGGREGYETLLNTDLKGERAHAGRFLQQVVEYKHKIGFKGAILIEPKPQEPSKHQYDYDVATVYGLSLIHISEPTRPY